MKGQNNKNIITQIIEESIAKELNLIPGDELVSINDNIIKDYIDYKFHISNEYIILTIKHINGEIWDYEIEKEYDEDLGIIFENPLMDSIKTCRNKCLFCFIDQLPKGLRKSLYLKDDDTRLSFLYGNFITLTNLSTEEIDRIIKYHISPIKVSVHTTNAELRKKMLGNNKAGNIIEVLRKLSDANITIDCQIVLCRGINDKIELERTIDDLSKMYPAVRSVAIVPVGLTKYRENLVKLEKFDSKSSLELIEQVTKKQQELYKKIGTRFVFASDEFYVLCKKKLPPVNEYEGFNLLENGVGMFRLFEQEIKEALNKISLDDFSKEIKEYTVVTGVAAYDFMNQIAKIISNRIGIIINVIAIKNNFFGEDITVAGLITGKDIIDQLKDRKYKNIIIPNSMLKYDENIFLDDITIEKLEDALKTKVYVCEVNGEKFIKLLSK